MSVNDSIKRGSRVLVVEGPDKGEEGVVSSVVRKYDPGTSTLGWRVKVEIPEKQDQAARVISTRLAWVREL